MYHTKTGIAIWTKPILFLSILFCIIYKKKLYNVNFKIKCIQLSIFKCTITVYAKVSINRCADIHSRPHMYRSGIYAPYPGQANHIHTIYMTQLKKRSHMPEEAHLENEK